MKTGYSMRYHLISTALFIAVIIIGSADGIPVLEYYVTDEVGVLYIEEIYDIEDICVEVDMMTGAEIAVVIVETTQPRV